MAYDNVNFESAKNAINQCKSAIDYNYSKGIVDANGISTTSWDADCRDTYTNALKTLVNTRYKALEDALDECLSTINNMENANELSNSSSYYSNQIANKTYELGILKDQISRSGTPSNAYDAKIYSERLKKIKELEREIEELKNEKAEIDSQISQTNV